MSAFVYHEPAAIRSREIPANYSQNFTEAEPDRAMATNYQFGPFRLDAEAKILFRGAEPVALGRRAVAVLRVLVERAGVPVSKEALAA